MYCCIKSSTSSSSIVIVVLLEVAAVAAAAAVAVAVVAVVVAVSWLQGESKCVSVACYVGFGHHARARRLYRFVWADGVDSTSQSEIYHVLLLYTRSFVYR